MTKHAPRKVTLLVCADKQVDKDFIKQTIKMIDDMAVLSKLKVTNTIIQPINSDDLIKNLKLYNVEHDVIIVCSNIDSQHGIISPQIIINCFENDINFYKLFNSCINKYKELDKMKCSNIELFDITDMLIGISALNEQTFVIPIYKINNVIVLSGDIDMYTKEALLRILNAAQDNNIIIEEQSTIYETSQQNLDEQFDYSTNASLKNYDNNFHEVLSVLLGQI